MSQYPPWTVLPDAARKIAAKINDYLTAIVLDYSDVPPQSYLLCEWLFSSCYPSNFFEVRIVPFSPHVKAFIDGRNRSLIKRYLSQIDFDSLLSLP